MHWRGRMKQRVWQGTYTYSPVRYAGRRITQNRRAFVCCSALIPRGLRRCVERVVSIAFALVRAPLRGLVRGRGTMRVVHLVLSLHFVRGRGVGVAQFDSLLSSAQGSMTRRWHAAEVYSRKLLHSASGMKQFCSLNQCARTWIGEADKERGLGARGARGQRGAQLPAT